VPTRAVTQPGYAIVGVTVVDVEAGILVPGQTIVTSGEAIQAVGPRPEVSVPAGSTVIDGQGLYAMPGLVDAHVHYLDPEVFGRVLLANGVLLVRDMGQPTEQVLQMRAALNRGEMLGPEMIATGWMLDGDPPLIPYMGLGLDSPDEARAAVRAQAAAGVDEIKVYSRLKRDVFFAILEAAESVGLTVVGHVPDSVSLEDAAAAGLGSSEHLFGFEKLIGRLLGEPVSTTYSGMGSEADYLKRLSEVDPEELAAVFSRLRDSGLTVCPTVVVFRTEAHIGDIRAGSLPHGEYISAWVLDLWTSQWGEQSDIPDAIWQNWAQMVRQLNDAGVQLMVGTDLITPGIVPGFAVHAEMEIWQAAGIPPADVLRAATLVPARFMGLEGRLGSLTAGKAASLVLLTADPLQDIRNAAQIEAVLLRGQYYSRDDLNRLLDEAQALAELQTRPPNETGN
jgi:imidazolonepropionase-like amidohydrolase